MSENLEIILKNSKKYKVNIYKILGLKLYVILQYLNSWDNYNAKKLVDWFNKNDQEGQFKLWLMNNDEKHIYARYIKFIGRYYKNCSNNQVAIEYYIRAKEAFDKVKDYETFKRNVFYALATSNIALGQIQEAKKYTNYEANVY
ncbi:MAG: hypothetical protein LN575_03740 [Rickettsia endosymbiont of Gnoriste bilineata]|nr:hypothetical protein [Rickettsia endosymbiont of Gnoriste bilineata]